MNQPTVTLESFLLQSLLGRGGMGDVWRAVHVEQRMPVAIKLLPGERSAQEAIQRRFIREVQALAGLSHPGIISVFEHGVVDEATAEASAGRLEVGSLYLVMELAEGGTLEQQPPLSSWAQLRWVLTAVLDALAYAHARGVIHRDIKPQNILVSHEQGGDRSELRRLKLTDFGIAFAMDDQETLKDEKSRIAGSVRYMAPEQLLGWWRDQGPWTDLYGLGCMAYQLATGALPFGRVGHNHREVANQHIRHPVPEPECRFHTPDGFVPWLMKMLAKTPEKRFRCAADAARALMALGLFEEPELEGGVITSAVPLEELLPTFPWTWRRKNGGEGRALPPSIGMGLYGLRVTPMAGRRPERNALWRALGQVHAQGKASVLVLRGEPGVGKSRLASWLCQRAHELGLANQVRAVHDKELGPHTGLSGLVEEQLRVEGLDRDAVLDRVKLLMHRRGIQEPYWWLSLAAIAFPDPSPVAALSNQRAHSPRGGFRFRNDQERYQAVGFLIRDLCRERPVIVWLDDVQWSADSLQFVQFMVRAQGDDPCPAMFVLTTRPEPASSPACAALLDAIIASPTTTTLDLLPLDLHNQHKLIRGLLDLDDALAYTVAERTEGNPLFAVQLISDWVHRGVLDPDPDGFRLNPGVKVPENLQALWSSRLDQFLAEHPPSTRIAMELAAALGPTVVDHEWIALCQLQSCAIPPRLVASLIRVHLATPTDTGWAFVHSQLQANLLQQASRAGRLATHHQLCAAMLQVNLGHSGHRGLFERIGAHLIQAGDLEGAASALLQAAQEHEFGGDFTQAETLWRRWRDCMDALEPDPLDPRWARGALIHTRLLRRNGHYAEAVETLSRNPPVSDNFDNEPLLAEHLTELARATSALALVREDPDLFTEARLLHARAAAIYAKIADTDGLAEVALSQAITASMMSDWAEASASYSLALGHFDQLGDKLQYAIALVGMAEVDHHQRRPGDAWTKGQRALAIFERFGARYYICQALYHLAELDRANNCLDDAAARYRRILAFMEGLGSFNGHIVRHALAQVLIERADFAEASDLLHAILKALEPQQGPTRMLLTVRCHALICAAQLADMERFDALFNALPDDLDTENAALLERAGRAPALASDCALNTLRRAHDSFARHNAPERAAALEPLIARLQGPKA